MARKAGLNQKRLGVCPTCGGKRIQTVRTDYRTRVRGRDVLVTKLEREECPDCGEVLFGPEAMRRIQSYRRRARSPA